jgi:ribosome recycling factor
VHAVDRAIREANRYQLIIDGTTIRLPIPTLTAERRTELAKLAHKYAEQHQSPCATRREGMELQEA